MATTEPAIQSDDAHDPAHDAHEHPTDRKYVNIALTLAVLTAIEVALFVLEDSLGDAIVKVGLLSLMAVKFWLVGAFFMHLKFDDSILARLFIFGLALAVIVYIAMLSAFEFFGAGIKDPGLPG